VHDDAIAAILEIVQSSAAAHHAPSVAWGVVRDGALWATGAVGELDDGTTPSPRTVYRIASMTKSFTAAAVLALRDDGVLRLDDPITAHAPELAAVIGPTLDAATITLGDLLSMSSGLATDDVWADRHLDITDDELDALMATGAHFAVDTGTAFEYSNLGFALIGRVVLRTTGTPVQQHVSQRFIGPLGLRRTTWTQPDHDDWARPYRWDAADDAAGGAHAPESLVGDGALAPMGGIWSCIEDLAVWTDWLDHAFPARDEPDDGPLRRASRREMQQIHRYAGTRELAGRSAPQGYGYGVLLRDDPVLGPLAGHSGGLPGYGSNMRWAPGRRLGVIALANVTYAPMAELTLRIFDALHAAGEVPESSVQVSATIERLATELVALLNDWDDARADALFTDNVALDESYTRRRSAATAVAADNGRFTISSITALSGAGADVMLTNGAGSYKLEVELAPLVPARIESFSLARIEAN